MAHTRKPRTEVRTVNSSEKENGKVREARSAAPCPATDNRARGALAELDAGVENLYVLVLRRPRARGDIKFLSVYWLSSASRPQARPSGKEKVVSCFVFRPDGKGAVFRVSVFQLG